MNEIKNWVWTKTNTRTHENFYQYVMSKVDMFEKKLNSFHHLKKTMKLVLWFVIK